MAANQTGRSARKAPISRHPAFPAIVALWFAALLGVGSLVVPVALFEKLIVATGLPSAIPSAQPPLDIGARILIALVGAGLGVIAGLYIARQVANAQDARPSRRPISAREELGAGSFDEPVQETHASPVRKRLRTLTSFEANDPVATAAEAAPAAAMAGADSHTTESSQPDAAPLDLAAFAADAETELEAEPGADAGLGPSRRFDMPAAFAAPAEAVDAAPEASDCPMFEHPGDPTNPFSDREDVAAPEEQATPPAAADASCTIPGERPLRELSIAELVERFALSLQRAAERADAAAATEETDETETAAAPSAPHGSTARYVPDLGVDMSEAPAPGLAAEVPAALRPIEAEELGAEWDEDDDDCLSFSLPLATFASEGDDEVGEEPPAEDGYSSLLHIRPIEARRAPPLPETGDGDLESPPAAAFPRDAHAPAPTAATRRPFDAPASADIAPDRAQAERALREALHKLQQMSGAA